PPSCHRSSGACLRCAEVSGGHMETAVPGGDMSTRWLTPEEQRAWVALTGMLIKLPTALDAAMAKEAGLTFFEYMVLAMLAEEDDGTLRMSTLAERTNGSLSRLSHVVRRLEKQDLVERVGAPED